MAASTSPPTAEALFTAISATSDRGTRPAFSLTRAHTNRPSTKCGPGPRSASFHSPTNLEHPTRNPNTETRTPNTPHCQPERSEAQAERSRRTPCPLLPASQGVLSPASTEPELCLRPITR
jgi:hypothetical protein